MLSSSCLRALAVAANFWTYLQNVFTFPPILQNEKINILDGGLYRIEKLIFPDYSIIFKAAADAAADIDQRIELYAMLTNSLA